MAGEHAHTHTHTCTNVHDDALPPPTVSCWPARRRIAGTWGKQTDVLRCACACACTSYVGSRNRLRASLRTPACGTYAVTTCNWENRLAHTGQENGRMSWCVRLCLQGTIATMHTSPTASAAHPEPSHAPVQVAASSNHLAALIACNGVSAALLVTGGSPRSRGLLVLPARVWRLVTRAWRRRRRPQLGLRLHRRTGRRPVKHRRLHHLRLRGRCRHTDTSMREPAEHSARARARSRARTHHDVWLTGEKWAAAHHGQCSAGRCCMRPVTTLEPRARTDRRTRHVKLPRSRRVRARSNRCWNCTRSTSTALQLEIARLCRLQL